MQPTWLHLADLKKIRCHCRFWRLFYVAILAGPPIWPQWWWDVWMSAIQNLKKAQPKSVYKILKCNLTQSFTYLYLCIWTHLANSFPLPVSLGSSLLALSLTLDLCWKFRSAPVTTAKSPTVQRQRAVANHWQNLVCTAPPSTMEDRIVCQLHFHC